MKFAKSSYFKFFILSILFILFIFFLAKSYSDTMFKNISNNFLRLHIVANSDSTEDQILKYEIRDAILNYISPYIKNASSKHDAIQILNNNMDELYNLSSNILNEHGLNYPVNISIGNFNFPTKDYSSFILPEGNYDALKIELGNAIGQNWWCVMFPSLCIVDTSNFNIDNSSMDILKNTLDSEEFSIISKDNTSPEIKIKFKLIELFENL